MVQVLRDSNEFDKVLEIISEMEEKGLLKETESYNSIISALGKNPEYAE
jgi:pentatricopeptide repeat protein